MGPLNNFDPIFFYLKLGKSATSGGFDGVVTPSARIGKQLKGKELLQPELVRQSFGDHQIRIMTDAESLKNFLESISWRKNNLF